MEVGDKVALKHNYTGYYFCSGTVLYIDAPNNTAYVLHRDSTEMGFPYSINDLHIVKRVFRGKEA